MPDEKSRKVIPSSGVFQDLSIRIKLILRLMADPRVPFWLKLLPIGSLVYLFVPDLAIGPIDDAMIIWLGAYLFIELCPQHVVEEHLDELKGNVVASKWRDIQADEINDVVEGEFRDPSIK
ncbi:MAG: hypothetical protein AB1345_11410 [Chloroflexota bacterium]